MSSGLTVANLVALFVGLQLVLVSYDAHDTTTYLVPQDVWGPFLYVVWGLAALNGACLLPWRSTRRIGVGLLLGTATTMVIFFLWLLLVVAPALG